MSRFRAILVGRRALLLGALLTSLSAGQAWAQDHDKDQDRDQDKASPKEEEPEYRFDFGLFGGGHFFTQDHALGRAKGDPTALSAKTSGMFGGEFGLHLNRWIGFEGELALIPTRTRNDQPDLGDFGTKVFIFAYRGSFVLNLNDSYIFQPFLLAGYGALTSLVNDSTKASAGTEAYVHAGAGFKIGFTPRIGIRFDGRISVPWTALPVIPHGERIGYTGPDFEVFGGLYLNFSEIERVHIYHNQRIIEKLSGDKDGDRIPDDVDKCPNEPEDKDGFQDDDGCPDPDNDHDGIPDALDRCPNEPEDKDGFQDDDGCPDPDNDHDGIPDALDKCPNEPEDKDGFQDDDGCPDPDNDGDGIPDKIDKCPNESETINHYKDEDGCPDEVPPEVKKFTGVIEGINFKTGSAEILPGSFAILDRALKVLQDFPDVNLEISGHTDRKGKATYNLTLSQHRADAVKLYFVSRGIASTRLMSIGYGKTRPIADNSTASGRATNRRTEFRLIDAGSK
jgi:outer membrane protein OmpA-like peptidoglycan-associated protein